MNIVLTSVHIDRTPDAIPLAPALLKTYLEDKVKSKNLSVNISEYFLNNSIDDCAKDIISLNPDIVGLSIYLWNRNFYLKLIAKLRDLRPSIVIISGGAEVRSDYNTLLEKGIDYTLQGEGEELFLEFITSVINGTDPSRIDGINDNISRYIKDIDSIPSPLVNNNIDLKKYDGFLWELSRGCPFSCDFCFESRGFKGVRYYNLDRIEKELDIIVEEEVDQVFVLDPTFNKDLKRAKSILKLIKNKNRGTHFHFEVRAELLDRELSNLFSEVGASLQIGIQSGHDNVLKLINRRLNREKFSKKISLLNEAGTVFGLDLIYGLPGDSYSGFKESMEYVLSLQPNHVDIFPLAVLPGTALFDNANSLKLDYLRTPPYTVISSPGYSTDDMEKSRRLKEACDYIYNRGKSTGWLSQVCEELRIGLTDFIEMFYPWSREFDLSIVGNEINIILNYIRSNYKCKNYNLIKDIINYHASYSKALLSKKTVTKIAKKNLFKAKISLSETLTIGEFSYDLLSAFESGCYTIKLIKRLFTPDRSNYVSWYHSGGDVMFDYYPKKIIEFLKCVNGKKSAMEIDKQIDPEFLTFAQDSGLLLFK